MVDDRDRSTRRGGTDVSRESVEDILARNGLGGAASGPHTSTGGRAARRRAAEEQERALRDAAPPLPRAPEGGRHSARPPDPGPGGGRRPGSAQSRADAAGAATGEWVPAGPADGGRRATRPEPFPPPPAGPGRNGSGGGHGAPRGGPVNGPVNGTVDAPTTRAVNGTANGTGGRNGPSGAGPAEPAGPGRNGTPNGPGPHRGRSGADAFGVGAGDLFGAPPPHGAPGRGPSGDGAPPPPYGAGPTAYSGPEDPFGPHRAGAPPAPGAPPRGGSGPTAFGSPPPGPGGYGPAGPAPGRNGAPLPPGPVPNGTPHGPGPHGARAYGRGPDAFGSGGSPAPEPNGSPVGSGPQRPLPPGGPPRPAPPRGEPGEQNQLRPPAPAGPPAPRYPGQIGGPPPAEPMAPAPPAPPAEQVEPTRALPTSFVADPGAVTTALPARVPGPEPGAGRPGGAPSRDEPAQDPADPEQTRLTPADPDATRATRKSPAERESDRESAASRIDESLVRMTAAHAGLDLSRKKEDEEPPPPPVPAGRRAGRIAVRLLVAAVALVVLSAAGLGWGAKLWLDAGIRDAAALDLASSAIVDGEAQQGDRNVLMVASDRSRDPATRADTVVVAHVPAGGGPVVALSVPHNLEINRPACDQWDAATASYTAESARPEANTQLITALDLGGPRCITRAVQQLTGLAITQYVGLDLGAVEGLSAAMQGVDVCVPTPVVDGALGTIVADPGTGRLDGVRAADFVRALDVAGDQASEVGRIDRQQEFLNAVLDRTLDERSLLDIGRMTQLRPALREALLVDGGELDDVLALSNSLRRPEGPGVVFAVAPTTGGTDGIGNAVLRDADAAAVFSAVREDRDLPEEADPLEAVTGPAPAELRVQLLNASDVPGRAEQVGGALGALGFGVGEIGNADVGTNDTIIKFSPDQAAGAALLASSVPSATSVPDPGSTGVLQLVLGRSFDDVIQPPAAPAPVGPDVAALDPSTPRANCP